MEANVVYLVTLKYLVTLTTTLVIMKKTTRRDFISRTALTLGAAFGLGRFSAMANSREFAGMAEAAAFLNIPLGFQTFPIRDRLGKDLPGTLKTMAGYGYQLVELCSPV